jgi:hypothetical protein
MHARPKLLRILKFLGKAMLGLLLFLFLLILLVHVPAVQKVITRKVAGYLSARTEATVAIDRIRFSLPGSLVIEGVNVKDPAYQEILDIGRMEVSTNVFDLLKGNYLIDQISLKDVRARVREDEQGLNIRFILDAFQSPEKKETTSNAVNIKFTKVNLENIDFSYTSTLSETSMDVKLGAFICEDIDFGTHPVMLKAAKVSLQRTAVNVLSPERAPGLITTDTIIRKTHLTPDFDLGVGLEIAMLDIGDTDFSFHRHQVATSPKFDENHVDMAAINIRAKDILIRVDTLAAVLSSLSVKMPGFEISESKSILEMNKNGFALTGFQLASHHNTLQADLKGWYDREATDFKDPLKIEINAHGRIKPNDLAYFFEDAMMLYVAHWDTTNLSLVGNYRQGAGVIETFNLNTGNSQLDATGMVSDIVDVDKLQWKDLSVQATVGPDFRRTLQPFLTDIQLPPAIFFSLSSTGNPEDIALDGTVKTTWGNADVNGTIAPKGNNFVIDMDMKGEGINPTAWIDLPWLGKIDFTATAKGSVGQYQNASINGFISSVGILDQPIHDITFQGNIAGDSLHADITIADPDYKSHMIAAVSLEQPMVIISEMTLDEFNVSKLMPMDSVLLLTGNFNATVSIDDATMEGIVDGDSVRIHFGSAEYELDSMNLAGLLSPDSSRISYRADDALVDIESNFDLLASQEMLETWTKSVLNPPDSLLPSMGSRALGIDLQLTSPGIFHVLGMDVTDFDTLFVSGAIDEQKQSGDLSASAGHFMGYGISLDSFQTQATAKGGVVTGSMDADHVFYATTDIGHIDLDLVTNRDTVAANLRLSRDTAAYLDFHSRLFPRRDGVQIYPDALELFKMKYQFGWNEPVFVSDSGVVFDQLLITHDQMQLSIDGDLDAFDVDFKHIDLTRLNQLYFQDTAVITAGHLNGMISYVRDQQLNLQADVDSLSLYHSAPITITATAVKEGNEVPFNFLLTNTSNKVSAEGRYGMEQKVIDASLLVDIQDMELFSFLVTDVLKEMHGSIKGEAKIKGPVAKPDIKGQVRFVDAGFTTADPSLILNIKDDVIYLDTSGLSFNDFTVYDERQHPLTISGHLDIADFPTYAYDLQINTDEYTLINTPESSAHQLKGLLNIGADVKLKGNDKDTYVDAQIKINDITSLIYVVEDEEIGLLDTEGIIEFVDPAQLLDTTSVAEAASYYDSLVATLPDFNLTSHIGIQSGASIKIITNEQSGDYLQASGVAELDLVYDRTGVLKLSGEYTIDKGLYRVSFYDLVKRNFELTKGSSIIWRGSPKSGDLNITAENRVASNSIGLIGNDVAENEQTIYKRSLDYIVGIHINGTIEKPVVSFSLDLSKEDRANYPVLANKLDRMKLPEFQSELNKQVFGLLVLGGFLPETSGADVDQAAIATTALSNSVNSLLAGQLNRFAGQYIKGVNIDVGLQSYSDYSSPGGKTKTTLDFKVSKSILNERLSFEIGGDFDINSDQSGGNTGDNYRGDVAIIYDLTGNSDKVIKLFNNETYDIVYQEIRNTGISLIFIREFNKGENRKRKEK